MECLETGGWWVHLRRCDARGHIGCCDSSPSQRTPRRPPVVASFEPGEDRMWGYATEEYAEGPALADPQSHPEDRPAAGPAGAVPDDRQVRLH